MKQQNLNLNLSTWGTCNSVFLGEMNMADPRSELAVLMTRHATLARTVDVGVGMNLRRVHTVIGTAARVNDAAQGHGLAHGQDEVVLLADARCQRVTNRPEATDGPWQVATAPGMRKVTKCQVDLTKPRYKGVNKKMDHWAALFSLRRMGLARRTLRQEVRE